jgi:hypothetical protein
VLFLDEPTTGLDPRSRTNMWDVIRELVRHGTTLLLTTQYLEEADRLADDIVVIDHGRAIATAPPTSSRPRSAASGRAGRRRRADLLDRRGLRWPARRRRGARRRAQPARCVPVRAAPGPDATCCATSTPGRRVLDVGLRRPTLDDVFLALTGHVAEAGRMQPEGAETAVASCRARAEVGRAAVRRRHVVAKRNLIKIKRVPEVLVWVLISPIMFVLLFAYVFGGSIDPPGRGGLPRVPHRRDLRPDGRLRCHLHRRGAGRGHAEGHHRPVPVAADVASAVLVGRTASDVVYNVLSIAIMSLTGLLVGWRIRGSLLDALGGLPAAAAVRLRLLVGDGLRGSAGAERRGRQQRVVHGHLPADLHLQRLRAPREPSGPLRPSPSGTRSRRHPGGPGGVRQRHR